MQDYFQINPVFFFIYVSLYVQAEAVVRSRACKQGSVESSLVAHDWAIFTTVQRGHVIFFFYLVSTT